MLTKTAELDIKALRQNGFSPTDEEVVRLNDLAMKIERGKDTTPANMPRVAFAGSVVLYEPTIGALEWWYDFGRDADFTFDGHMTTYFFMLAHARQLDFLCRLKRPKDIRCAVKCWKKTVDATSEELWRALLFVKNGTTQISENDLEMVKEKMSDQEAMDYLWRDLLMAAGATGISPDTLKTSTHSELLTQLTFASQFQHTPLKRSVAQDYIAYRQLLRKIEDRGSQKKEVPNG